MAHKKQRLVRPKSLGKPLLDAGDERRVESLKRFVENQQRRPFYQAQEQYQPLLAGRETGKKTC